MSALAVRLAFIDRTRTDTAQNILFNGNYFQVFWINAVFHAAEMVELLTFWNGPAK
jgi:hypothetical protein